MNNPNPFVPQGSLLELASKRRSRMKIGVFCVLVAGVAGLTAMLIQGCKREQATDETNNPPPDTNMVAAVDTNLPPMVASNPPVAVTPPPVAVAPPPVENPGSEYVVVHGDTLGKIAKSHGVTLSALKAANPGVEPTKLKVGQKLTIPAGGTAPAAAGVSTAPDTGMGGVETYVVKSGDTLTKIAKAHGTTAKAIEAASGLSTTKIKVGQKLKIPSKAEAAAPAPAPLPAAAPAPGPVPAPTGTPAGQ